MIEGVEQIGGRGVRQVEGVTFFEDMPKGVKTRMVGDD